MFNLCSSPTQKSAGIYVDWNLTSKIIVSGLGLCSISLLVVGTVLRILQGSSPTSTALLATGGSVAAATILSVYLLLKVTKEITSDPSPKATTPLQIEEITFREAAFLGSVDGGVAAAKIRSNWERSKQNAPLQSTWSAVQLPRILGMRPDIFKLHAEILGIQMPSTPSLSTQEVENIVSTFQ